VACEIFFVSTYLPKNNQWPSRFISMLFQLSSSGIYNFKRINRITIKKYQNLVA